MTAGDPAEHEPGFTTRAVHPPEGAAVTERPLAPPIYQAATFAFDDLDRFASVAESKTHGGYLYSRWANPTVDALGRQIAALEGAEAAACFGSGMAAIHTCVATLLREGDHLVSAAQLYGGTHSLFHDAVPRLGATVTTVDVTDLEAVERAFTERTRVLYAETIGNPSLPVADLGALAGIAHQRGALLVVDATFTSPFLVRALEHGADLSIHSATKYLAGHSDVTGGVVSGSRALIESIRHATIDFGGIMGPFDAWLASRGVQTLALRMERVCDNALALARFLEGSPGVERVRYPGLASHDQHDLAAKLFGGRFGGMLTFDVAGGAAAGRRLLGRLRLASPAASLGGTKTLAVHPATVTHTQLTAEQRAAVGIGEGTIRVSVGIEDAPDLTADFGAALS